MVGYLGVGHGWIHVFVVGFLPTTSEDTGVRNRRSLLDVSLLITRETELDYTKSELPF